ncbi:hypothetical protein [Sulfurimonas hydrogeniphila]|uniref:hypothetical protein n=1 Tax=Sulfurimonas hydrogeniphila TaxID=2509341 RepID=UPI00125EF3B9|nr:hypothetical protein [Sulfurimonas hydrogeniphila]
MILLIEDRAKRQALFMQDTHIDLGLYSDILDNFIEKKYDTFVKDMLNDNFDFSPYDIIITHKSAYEDDNTLILDKLKTHCETNKKALVFFSGGVDENYYHNANYEFIITNSKVFYSRNLELFLQSYRENNHNLLMLIYGQRYKLNIALNIFESLSLFVERNRDQKTINYKKMIEVVDMYLLEDIQFDFKIEKDKFNKVAFENILELKKSLSNYIKKSIENE